MQPRPSFAVQQPVCIYIVYYDEKKEKKIDQSLSFFEFGLAKVYGLGRLPNSVKKKKKKEKKSPPLKVFFFTI